MIVECRRIDYDDSRCPGCGGINGLELWPTHAAGCNCSRRREARSYREVLSALSLRGSVSALELAYLLKGSVLRVAEGKP